MQNSKCRMQNEKNESGVMSYIAPELEVIELEVKDVITASPGTETTPKDEIDGIWDFDQG